MSPARHHPSSSLIASYATGTAPAAAALAVAAHVESCAYCATRVRAIEAAEGRLMASLPDAPLGADALARALTRLEAGSPPGAAQPPPPSLGEVALPTALADVPFAPRRWVGPGFWAARARLPEEGGWRLALLRAPAGARIPWHRHGGEEMIAVLEGAVADDAAYVEGDFAEHGAGGAHQLAVSGAGPCACLIAARGGGEWRGVGGLAAAWLGL